MKCTAFDEIYTIFAKDPMTEITPKLLSKMFRDNKKYKFTNTMLQVEREKQRPEII